MPLRRLLAYRFRSLWNATLSRHARNRRLNWVMALFVIPWSFFFFGGVGYGMGLRVRLAGNGALAMTWIATALLAGEFLLMLVGEVGGFANLLFFSGRGVWLRRAPIPGRRFLAYQIIEGSLVMAAVPTLFLLAIYLSVLMGYRPAWSTLVMGLATFGLVRVLPLGVSLVALWILVPRTHRESFRWLDAALGILFGLLMLALWRLEYRPDLMEHVLRGGFLPAVPGYLRILFPPAALGILTGAVLEGGHLPLETLVLALTQAALLIGLPVALAARLIETGRFPEASGGFARSRSWWTGPSGPVAAMVRKDLTVFAREGRLGLRLLSSATVTFVVLWLVVGASRVGAVAPALLLVFILASEAGTLVIPSEGRAVVWSSMAPVTPRRFILAKTASALMLTVTVTAPFALGLGLFKRWSPESWGQMAVAGPAVALFGVAMGLFLAVRWGRFDWDDPRRMLQPAAHLVHALVMLTGFVLMAGAGAAFEFGASGFAPWVLGLLTALCAAGAVLGLVDAVRIARAKEWVL